MNESTHFIGQLLYIKLF